MARILHELAAAIENGGQDIFNLRDVNGNKVGLAMYDSVGRWTSAPSTVEE